mmetsp:Transcript_43486/g.138728  ORF Transcript_43486/g.138728 Transcript_43486/m.138728 type:complete len:204 (-) Transcript_43486:796-1407(-)
MHFSAPASSSSPPRPSPSKALATSPSISAMRPGLSSFTSSRTRAPAGTWRARRMAPSEPAMLITGTESDHAPPAPDTPRPTGSRDEGALKSSPSACRTWATRSTALCPSSSRTVVPSVCVAFIHGPMGRRVDTLPVRSSRPCRGVFGVKVALQCRLSCGDVSGGGVLGGADVFTLRQEFPAVKATMGDGAGHQGVRGWRSLRV